MTWRTLLICYHPNRRTHRVFDAVCQVCPVCLAVRSTDQGLWLTECRLLYSDGRMTTVDGREIHDDWRAVHDRAGAPERGR